MENYRDRLISWNKLEFSRVGLKIAELQKCLQYLQLRNGDTMNGEIEEVWRALNGWLDTESVMWNQRSRNMWLVGGDQSTSFFHAKALHRHQINLILGLCDAEGVWQEDDQRIENIVVDYYTSIFKSNGPTNASTVVNAI